MSESLEKAEQTKPPSSSVSRDLAPEVVAIALSDQGYWRRVWRSIVWQTEEYVKKDFAYSLLAAAFLGALTLLDRSATITTLVWAVIGFLAVFGAQLARHAVSSPALIDKAITQSLASSERRVEELTRRKVTYEIDESLTRVRLHSESPTVVRLTADIALYFINNDSNNWSLKRLNVTLHRLQAGGPVDIYAYHFMRYRSAKDNSPIGDFERMLIQGGTKSEPYIATSIISIEDEIKHVSEMGSLCFLRVSMETTNNQPPLEADIFLNWENALSQDGVRPTLIMGVETINKITDRRIG